MRIVGREKIADFGARHPEAMPSLAPWVDIVSAVIWKHTADVRTTFRTADFVEGKVVFNVGGNNCRIIASIVFPARLVQVRDVLSHKDYDKDKWK